MKIYTTKLFSRKTVLLSVCLTALSAHYPSAVYSAPSSSASSQSMDATTNFVDKLGREAIDTLTNPNMDISAIESQFLNLLNRDFQVPRIAQFVLGRYWKVATEDQRDRFTKLFVDRLKKAYANRFKEYRGVNFTVKGKREQNGYEIVTSSIQKPGGVEVQVDWWIKSMKIYDVVVDGISMRTTLRDDYGSSIAAHSGNIDSFLTDLQKRS